jgi:hypothetical protein
MRRHSPRRAPSLGTSAPPQACLDAYARAVTANPAFAFADGLISRYFGKLVLVAPPPIARHTLVGLTLDYKWTGMGTERSWSLKISDAATKPNVTVTGASAKAGVDVRDKIAAFGSKLESFLPIPQPVEANVSCIRMFLADPTLTSAPLAGAAHGGQDEEARGTSRSNVARGKTRPA